MILTSVRHGIFSSETHFFWSTSLSQGQKPERRRGTTFLAQAAGRLPTDRSLKNLVILQALFKIKMGREKQCICIGPNPLEGAVDASRDCQAAAEGNYFGPRKCLLSWLPILHSKFEIGEINECERIENVKGWVEENSFSKFRLAVNKRRKESFRS